MTAWNEGLEPNARRFLRFLDQTTQTLEIQVLGTKDRYGDKNWSTHPRGVNEALRLLVEADKMEGKGVFLILNEPTDAVASRTIPGKFGIMAKGESTGDLDILRRRAFFVDVDYARPTGTSTTAPEMETALTATEAIRDFFEGLIDPAAIGWGCSGNGGSVFVALDHLPESPELKALCKRGIAAATVRWQDPKLTADKNARDCIAIDSTVVDAKRLVPAYGTTKRKGNGLDPRPHRQTWFECADVVTRLSFEQFKAFIEALEEGLPKPSPAKSTWTAGADAPATNPATSTPSRANGPALGGGGPERPARAEPKTASERANHDAVADAFRRANEVPIDQVISWLGLTACPGCGETQGTAIFKNGWKCSHNRCADKGRPPGFRNCIDLVAEVKGVKPIKAVRLLGEQFGFEIPKPERKPPPRTDGGVGSVVRPDYIEGLIFKAGNANSEPKLAPLSANVTTVLQSWTGAIAFDEFRNTVVMLRQLPSHPEPAKIYPCRWEDLDTGKLQRWFSLAYQLHADFAFTTIKTAVNIVSKENSFHPLKDELESVEWDGIPRCNQFASEFLGAEDNIYHQAVGSKFLLAAIARLYCPGEKVDTCVVLEGNQGERKSSALRALAGDRYFSDSMPDLHSKDALQQLPGTWIFELGELAAMKKSEIETVKRFMSTQVDKYRPSHMQEVVEVPRSCVFAASTNKDEYLSDETGARRFWPIRIGTIGTINLDRIKEERLQIWAEALHRYRAGEKWYFQDKALEEEAKAQQDLRREIDPWEETIRGLISKNPLISVLVVLKTLFSREVNGVGMVYDEGRITPREQNRVARILIALGLTKHSIRANGRRYWVYCKRLPSSDEVKVFLAELDRVDLAGSQEGSLTRSVQLALSSRNRESGIEDLVGMGKSHFQIQAEEVTHIHTSIAHKGLGKDVAQADPVDPDRQLRLSEIRTYTGELTPKMVLEMALRLSPGLTLDGTGAFAGFGPAPWPTELIEAFDAKKEAVRELLRGMTPKDGT